MQRLEQLAALLLESGALLVQLLVNPAQLLQLGVDRAQLLLRLLDLAAAGQQAGHAGLHAAAGHGAAGVHHVALQRHQPQLIARRALDGDAAGQILGDDGAAQQAVHHALILFIIGNQLRGHAHAAGHAQHLPLLGRERAPAHRCDGQEGGPSEAVGAQVFDHALGVLVPIYHHVLKRSAQNHVDGALQLRRNVNQVRHNAVHAAVRRAPRLQKHLLDGIVVALVVPLHLPQQLHAGIGALALVLQLRDLRRQRLQTVVQCLHADVVLARKLLKLRLARFLGLQALPGLAHLLVQRRNALLLARAVALHALQLALQRVFHRAQARTLGAHIAQAVHRLDDLLLHLLGLFFHLGEDALRVGQLRFLLGELLGGLGDGLFLFVNLRHERLNALVHALATPSGGVPLGDELAALLLARSHAFAHHAHRALAGLHLADELLHRIALLRGGGLQLLQARLTALALGRGALQLPVGLQDRLAQGLDRLLQLLDALLVALGAHQEHVQVEYLQFIPQRKVLPGGLALSLQRLDALLQLGQDVLHAV